MKLVSLNIWGGTMFEPLMQFIKEQSTDTDFFCFQEVFDTPTDQIEARQGARADIYRQLQKALPEFHAHFDSAQDNYEYGHAIHGDTLWDISFGLACFIRKNIPLTNYGEFFIFKEKNGIYDNKERNGPRNIQYFQWDHHGVPYTILNYHGIWHPTIKKIDYPDRIEQSQKLCAFMEALPGEKILCGDLNLNPDTESLALLEHGMRNLIKEYGITSTRSELYTKELRFADYALVTPGVSITNFSVPNISVSDHLPMIVEFL